MRVYVSSFLAICCALTQAGCATIVSGKTQDVMIHSNPSGAHILIDDAVSGITPMVANLVRKQRHTIAISKDGYVSITRGTTKGFNWWYIGNLLFGGAIGLIVDPITGAMFEVKPGEVNVALTSNSQIVSTAQVNESAKSTPGSLSGVVTGSKITQDKTLAGTAMESAIRKEQTSRAVTIEKSVGPLRFVPKYPETASKSAASGIVFKKIDDAKNIPPAKSFEETRASAR